MLRRGATQRFDSSGSNQPTTKGNMTKRKAKLPDLVAAGVRWRKVEKAQTWRPAVGDVLQGSYVGQRDRLGAFGIYQLHTIKCEDDSFNVSGTVAGTLLSDAGVQPGDLVRLVFTGMRRAGATDRMYKDYELYVESKK